MVVTATHALRVPRHNFAVEVDDGGMEHSVKLDENRRVLGGIGAAPVGREPEFLAVPHHVARQEAPAAAAGRARDVACTQRGQAVVWQVHPLPARGVVAWLCLGRIVAGSVAGRLRRPTGCRHRLSVQPEPEPPAEVKRGDRAAGAGGGGAAGGQDEESARRRRHPHPHCRLRDN